MATEETVVHEHEHDLKSDWSGGTQPFKASYGKLMMWYFLLSDAFTFAGFLIAYGTLRFSMPSWPVPDFVFKSLPGLKGDYPLIFVTIMTFVLIVSSVTMVRAVQEGHRENQKGVVNWMILTVIGGLAFLSCQAIEWYTLIKVENMSVTIDPFGSHTEAGVYLDHDGNPTGETFNAGESYLIHVNGTHHAIELGHDYKVNKGEEADFADAVVDKKGYIHQKYLVTEGIDKGEIKSQEFGPKAFGALFFFITGFHGFHVLSGIAFLLIVLINVASGLYRKRKNGYEMVEKVGLYWHFVDLVWVFVFLLFYLL